MSSLSIAIGGISHESHSFAGSLTALSDFEQNALVTGGGLLDHAQGSQSALAGIIDAAGKDVTLVPLLFASAMPGGPVEESAWTSLSHQLLTRIRSAAIREPGIDGVVLVLHGGMITTADDDPDGALVESIRSIVGGSIPIIVVVSSHANPSARLIAESSAILSYRASPHAGMQAAGAAALAMCRAFAQRDVRPCTAVRRLPMLLPLTAQRTGGPAPIARMMRQVSSLTRLPGVLQANLIPGFPYADVAHAGVTITVTTDNDKDLAESLASRFGQGAWQFMRSLSPSSIPLPRLAHPLIQTSGKPIVYADIADNPAVGAPGNHTGLLRHALHHRWTNGAFAAICDPDAVFSAHQAGVGHQIAIGIGGLHTPFSADPVHATWTVASLSQNIVPDPYPTGHGTADFGKTAALTHRGIVVIVSERRQQVRDLAILNAHQIKLPALRWICVKSGDDVRAAFDPLAAEIVEVDAGGCTTEKFSQFPWRRIRRPMLPLDPITAVEQAMDQASEVGANV